MSPKVWTVSSGSDEPKQVDRISLDHREQERERFLGSRFQPVTRFSSEAAARDYVVRRAERMLANAEQILKQAQARLDRCRERAQQAWNNRVGVE